MSNTCTLSVVGVDHGDKDLAAAVRMTCDAGGELQAILVSCVPYPLIGGPGYGGDSPFALIWEEHRRLETQANELTSVLTAGGLRGMVTPVFCSSGQVSSHVARHANSADITVIGGTMANDLHLARRVVDGVLFHSSCPLLILPKRRVATLRPKQIVVAWNGRREAWIAVRSSITLLQNANRVHVALVDVDSEASGEANGADLAGFLLRHGVEVVIDHLHGSDDPAIVLQRHAESLDADLIVMGAYGHSRLGERILGGTTETMLQHPAIPVLMAR